MQTRTIIDNHFFRIVLLAAKFIHLRPSGIFNSLTATHMSKSPGILTPSYLASQLAICQKILEHWKRINRMSKCALRGFGLGVAVNYVDERTDDTEASFTLPDYWRVDLFSSYAINDHWHLCVAVENLFDETYYEHTFS